MDSIKHQQKNPRGKKFYSVQNHILMKVITCLCEFEFQPHCPAFQIAVKKLKSKGDKEKKVDYFTDVHGLPCIDKIVTSVDETPVPIATHIIGKIPEWISGNFLRNGPGKFEIGNHK